MYALKNIAKWFMWPRCSQELNIIAYILPCLKMIYLINYIIILMKNLDII